MDRINVLISELQFTSAGCHASDDIESHSMPKLTIEEYAGKYGIPVFPATRLGELRKSRPLWDRNDKYKLIEALNMKMITFPRPNGFTGTYSRDNTYQVIITYPRCSAILSVEPDSARFLLSTEDEKRRPLVLPSLGIDSIEGSRDCLASQAVVILNAISRLPRNRLLNGEITR